jgi:hypothetical protein
VGALSPLKHLWSEGLEMVVRTSLYKRDNMEENMVFDW